MSQGDKHQRVTPEQERELERQKEAERLRLEKEAEALRKAREEAARKETEAKSQLRRQIPALEKELASARENLRQTEQHFAALSESIDHSSSRLNQTRAQLAQLQKTQSHLSNSIKTLSQTRELSLLDVQNLQRQVTAGQILAKETMGQWASTLREVKNARLLSTEVLTRINQAEKEMDLCLNGLDQTAGLIAQSEKDLDAFSGQLSQMDQSYGLLSGQLSMLNNATAAGTAAFIEIQVLRNQGYQLRSLQAGEELNLWFEDLKGEKKIAVKIKNTAKNEGLSWLRELDLSGFREDETRAFSLRNVEELEDLGVEYELIGRRSPRNPPPGSMEDWKRKIQNSQTRMDKI